MKDIKRYVKRQYNKCKLFMFLSCRTRKSMVDFIRHDVQTTKTTSILTKNITPFLILFSQYKVNIFPIISFHYKNVQCKENMLETLAFDCKYFQWKPIFIQFCYFIDGFTLQFNLVQYYSQVYFFISKTFYAKE